MLSNLVTRGFLTTCALSLALLAGCGDKPANGTNSDGPNGSSSTGNSTGTTPAPTDAEAQADAEAVKQAKAIATKAYGFMQSIYNKERPHPKMLTWGPEEKHDGGVNSFVILSALKAGVAKADDPMIKEAIERTINSQKATGGWDFGNGQRAVYLTSSAIMGLSWVRDHGGATYAGMKDAINNSLANGMDYLRRAQVGQPSTDKADLKARDTNIFWGGWAYSEEELNDPSKAGKPMANNSTTAFALDAAAAFGVAKDDKLWEAAMVYLKRSQNYEESGEAMPEVRLANGKIVVNPAPNDPNYGGSRYSPDSSMVKESDIGDGKVVMPSYGSMTYALLRGYLMSGLKKNDPRVELAYKWLKTNFSVDDVPGFPDEDGQNFQGYYYQFMQIGKTLPLMGERTFMQNGIKVDWRTRLLEKLATLQAADGSFMNEKDRWQEGDQFICTSYVLLACAEIINAYGK